MEHLQRDFSREAFLGRAGIGLAAACTGEALSMAQAAAAEPSTPRLEMGARNPADALEKLKAGNVRYVAGQPRSGPQSARLVELASGQNPFAIILGCSDSRVPIETVFDQIPGNVFAVRVAGNFLNDTNFGSIEYGVAVLKARLIVVLGHTKCGAVGAAVSYVKDGTTQPGHIATLVEAIVPAAKATRGAPGDWVANAIVENVRRNMREMTAGSKIIADAVSRGDAEVTGGVYELHTGRVNFF
ncbi:MAG TPA: carbonic anhydrase [Candidatus Acidoferrum sp.]|jgi:carbonic anhydrase|nr:carbonic anhydrase [Candidatus Acidoferrum sp.]